MKISRQQIYQIAGHANVDPRTVKNTYEGGGIKNIARERIIASAKALRLPMPPAAKAVQKVQK